MSARFNCDGFVVRLELEELLVERGGLRIEAFADEVLGDAGVLRDRLVGLAGAHVEVAEGVGRGPVARLVLDHAEVLGDGGVEPPLPEQLLRLFQRVFAVDGPPGFSTSR